MGFLEDRDLSGVGGIPEFYNNKTVFITGGTETITMGFLEDRDLSGVGGIPEFYNNKTVFITGGTGFIGKVLIEKLLYSCPGLERIYLLMRKKRNINAQDRLQKLYKYSCFDRLRKEKPDIFEAKVQIIPGDISKDGLDLSEEDRTLLVNTVNVVLHGAATVRFDDLLSYSVKLNLKGTLQMIELAQEMKHLAVFVHISTAYSNTHYNPVEEKIYPPVTNWRDVLEICDKMDDHTLEVLTTKYIGVMPNTYIFSKQLAEQVVYEMKGQLPVVIVRPSIVVAAVEEPIPGWIENFNGPVGFFVGTGKGILRSVFARPDLFSNFIPVDLCVKYIIAVSWIRGIKKLETTDDVPIYNCCSNEKFRISLQELAVIAMRETAILPLNDVLWAINIEFTTSRYLHLMRVFFKQLLPAILIDTILWLMGKKTMLVKIQKSVFRANIALEYYMTQNWDFKIENMSNLASVMKDDDINKFHFDVKEFDIIKFYGNTFLSARRYLLNEKDEDIPRAKAHYDRMCWLDRFVRVAIAIIILWWFLNKFVF